MKINKKDIVCYILMVLYIVIYNTVIKYNGALILDFLWQYEHSLSITKGELVYKDINIITTPLYYFILAIALKINASVECKIVLDALIALLHNITAYKIWNKQEHSYIKSAIYTLIYLIFSVSGYAYNQLTVIISLIIILLLRRKSSDLAIYIGIMAMLCALCKQTTGVFVAVYSLVAVGIQSNKSNRLKDIMSWIFGFCAVGIIFLTYLILTNTLNSFFDYCLFGLVDFKGSYFIENKFTFGLIVYFLLLGIYKSIKEKDINIINITVISILQLTLMINIRDNIHMDMVLSTAILIYYTLNIKLEIKDLIILTAILISSLNVMHMKLENSEVSNICINSGIYDKENEEIEEKEKELGMPILKVCVDTCINDYLSGRNSGIFEMFLDGNLGGISKFKLIDNAIKDHVVCVSSRSGWQWDSDQIFEYMDNNYKQVYISDDTGLIYYTEDR